ncbi:MAG: pyridoxal phosphate-dependent aminotransferase [Litorilinea sp.]
MVNQPTTAEAQASVSSVLPQPARAPSIPLSSSVQAIAASRIRELADVAWGMENVIAVQFGESTLPTPPYIAEALAQAVTDGYTYYTENGGLASLRHALAAKYAELHDVAVDPDREIVVTASGTQALNVAIRCTLNPGDEALVLTPNWPNGAQIVRLFGATPVEVAYAADGDGFAIDYAALEAAVTPWTRLLIYTSPSNPLGWVATEADQRRLLDFCRRHRLWLLADEVYERLYYGAADGVAPSILRLCTRDDAVIVAQSFSKTYCMTGWRLGWIVTRTDLAAKAKQLNEFIISHAPSMIQRAGETALARGEDDIADMVEGLHARMAFCYDALTSMRGVTVARPQGAFYLFPRIDGVEDSLEFALNLLRCERLAVAPGMAFGAGGEGHVRFCYAPDMAVMEQAMIRFQRFVEHG